MLRHCTAPITALLLVAQAVAGQSDIRTLETSRGPVPLHVPASSATDAARPLIVLLHGYTSEGRWISEYMGLAELVNEYDFLLTYPDGTRATTDRNPRFWNASAACCDFGGSAVDDSGYLLEVIDAVRDGFAVDPDRIFLVGQSNGGFMAYRAAWDHADVIAAIVSQAGAASSDDRPAPGSPVHVLQVHGTADETIEFGGGEIGDVRYPGAVESAERWAAFNGCGLDGEVDPTRLDLDDDVDGAETTVVRYRDGCRPGGSSELWTLRGSTHVPDFNDRWAPAVLEWLLAHPKR